MAEEMLSLANLGVEVLRLDAVAFIWKKLGTNCENLPEAHYLIQAFNLIARITAPALIFKSEAIVHPDEVIKYISSGECQISYNPLLMALLWESLATREVRLLKYSMQKGPAIPQDSAWVNYVRSHDDIGWTFSDDDASELWINGYDHRQFLNEFYRGRFPGSFARGLPFQENPKTGDSRISGTCASLAGLEKAITTETDKEVTLAIKRILLIHGIILTIGGIPLIYLGDEIGTLNDYTYRDHPSKANDSRWVHRSAYDLKKSKLRDEPKTVENRISYRLRQLINLRKGNPVFSNHQTEIVELSNPHVFCYTRKNDVDYVMVVANFSEKPQQIVFDDMPLGSYKTLTDLDTKKRIESVNILLTPYDFKCIKLS
jgi:glycosidase